MVTKKIGVIGCGNMGGAILYGALESGVLAKENVYVYDINPAMMEKAKGWGVNLAADDEDVCKNIFAELCRSGQLAFVPSRIGSYWHNDLNADTEIDVAAVDRQNKRLFIGECKYHQKPVDLPVLTALQQKVAASTDLQNSFIRQGYQVLYGLFSKSGFTQRMLDQAEGRDDILLIQEDCVL